MLLGPDHTGRGEVAPSFHGIEACEDLIADLSAFTQADLNRIALRLNQRPRKTLDFRCPADVFNETVALTS
jgi:hypothetical protein